MLPLRQIYDDLAATARRHTPFGELTTADRTALIRATARKHHLTEAEAAEMIPLGSRARITRGIE